MFLELLLVWWGDVEHRHRRLYLCPCLLDPHPATPPLALNYAHPDGGDRLALGLQHLFVQAHHTGYIALLLGAWVVLLGCLRLARWRDARSAKRGGYELYGAPLLNGLAWLPGLLLAQAALAHLPSHLAFTNAVLTDAYLIGTLLLALVFAVVIALSGCGMHRQHRTFAPLQLLYGHVRRHAGPPAIVNSASKKYGGPNAYATTDCTALACRLVPGESIRLLPAPRGQGHWVHFWHEGWQREGYIEAVHLIEGHVSLAPAQRLSWRDWLHL